ncbi:MAG: GNAT family N-acetyltransferase [Pseudobdellovibrionaceae bacterium]|nr:MAG: GNAT family N-acetyltransferase [Pseudobdellovibrionaceae bacterium]
MENEIRNLKITKGQFHEAEELSQLAIKSKAHWPYDKEFIENCKIDLIISKDLASSDFLRVARLNNQIIGFYSFKLENDPEMEHLFVEPDFIGKGIGLKLWQHSLKFAASKGWEKFKIVADPFAAEKFYLRVGCKLIGTFQSPIRKDRKLPLLEYRLSNDSSTLRTIL